MRVRVTALVLVMLLMSGTAAMAQNKGAGFKIGVNFADLKVDAGDDDDDFLDRRTGIIGGVFYVFPIAPQFSFQPEWLYAQRGGKDPENSDFGVDVDYFEVPLLLRWDSTSSGQSTFNVFAGPSINFRHRARSEDDEGDVDIRDQVEKIDFHLVFGAGVEIGRFLIDGRYNLGLREVNKNAEEEDFSVKHRGFSIMAGFRF